MENLEGITSEALEELIEKKEVELGRLRIALADINNGYLHTDGTPTQTDPNPVNPPHGPQG